MKIISNSLRAVLLTVMMSSAMAQVSPFELSAQLFARGGGVQGGGGDTKVERDIKDIRNDILSWIKLGGAKNLVFGSRIDYDEYLNGDQDKETFGMLSVLKPGAVVINSYYLFEQDSLDPEKNVFVDGSPKVCKGFISKVDKRPYINCSVEKFVKLSDSEKYQLIHHEYAGLGRLEVNIGADSDYSLSRQITSFLEKVVISRLAVKKVINGIELKTRVIQGQAGLELASSFVFNYSHLLAKTKKLIPFYRYRCYPKVEFDKVIQESTKCLDCNQSKYQPQSYKSVTRYLFKYTCNNPSPSAVTNATIEIIEARYNYQANQSYKYKAKIVVSPPSRLNKEDFELNIDNL